jgi:hypothetical protein
MLTFLCGVLAHAETKWEYARLDYCSYLSRGGSPVGVCRLQFASSAGWRTENLEFSSLPHGQFSPDSAGNANMENALAKALDYMGGQGWELIAVVSDVDRMLPYSRMLFKRPVESERKKPQ